MEHMLRDKLNQRTASGPSQLRRNFKYFDRDASGDIDLDEFIFALNLMGLTFNHDQVVASSPGTTGRWLEPLTQDCDVMEYDFGAIVPRRRVPN